MNDTAFDLEDFSFWDVNDDSLFTEHEVYLASLIGSGQPGDPQQSQHDPHSNLVGSKKIPKVMLSKNDKRRLYAKMFSEAFNSGDSKQLLSFLEQCCTLNCEVIEKCVVKENPYLPKHVEIHGIQAIHQYWSSLFVTIPDCLMIMLETKLRIRNMNRQPPATANSSVANMQPTGTNNNTNNSNGSITNTTTNTTMEGSSIVSSFSFTGTKLYNLSIEGAVMHNPNGTITTSSSNDFSNTSQHFLTNGVFGIPQNNHTNTMQVYPGITTTINNNLSQGIGLDSAVTNNNIHNSAFRMGQMAMSAMPPGMSNPSAMMPLPVTNGTGTGGGGGKGRKRSANSDWPNQDPNFANPMGNAATTASSATAATPANWDINSTNINDRYNIFLHPPRRFSTLAGTPYGGSSGTSNYFHMKNHQLQSTLQHSQSSGKGSSEHVELNQHSRIQPGRYIDQEGHINFLGTLTMTLDQENKISKFEFLYSHMD